MSPCEHAEKRQCKRIFENGVQHYGFQCCNCGTWFSTAKKSIDFSRDVFDYDDEIKKRFRIQRTEEFAMIQELRLSNIATKTWAERNARTAKYQEYIESEEWKKKRLLVLQRDNFTCCGCLMEPAIHVHHLTYRNLGSELAYELVSLCVRCHEKSHDFESVDISGIMEQSKEVL